MPDKRAVRSRLGALLLVGWLVAAAPLRAAATGEVILHISDTHVTAASAGNLPAFVATANTAADGVTLVAHSGDALHDPAGPAPYAVFGPALAGLRVPFAVVPGNHDLDARFNWYQAGYPGTVVAVAGAYTLIGFDARQPDWGAVESQVRAAAAAGQRVLLMTHQPLVVPHTWVNLPCPDGACAAPKWRLAAETAARVQDLAARYDVAALLAGHLHATYYLRDATWGYEHIVTANLGAPLNPGKYYTALVAEADWLAPQMLRYDAAPVVLTSPRYYDAETGLGEITDPAPLRVRVVGAANYAQVQAVQITSPAPLTAQPVAPGVWEAAYDWRPLAGRAAFQISATVRYTDGRTQTVAHLGKVAGSYPNPAPAVSLVRAGDTLEIAIQDSAADLRRAALYVAGACVQHWPLTGQAAAQLRYPLAALPPGATLRVKVTDRFGRATAAALVLAGDPPAAEAPRSTPAPATPTPAEPPPTATAAPAPTALPVAPPATPTAAPTETPTPPVAAPPAPETPPPASPEPTTLTLQQGLAGYQGTTATYFDGAGAGYNAAAVLRVDALSAQRVLLQFMLAHRPPGVPVRSATLRLYVQSSSNANRLTVAAHRVLAPWQGRAAPRFNRQAATPWQVPGLGADRAYAATPSGAAESAAAGQWLSLAVTDLVRLWVQDPATNHGLVLLAQAAPGRVSQAFCSELGWPPCTAAQAPQLTISY